MKLTNLILTACLLATPAVADQQTVNPSHVMSVINKWPVGMSKDGKRETPAQLKARRWIIAKAAVEGSKFKGVMSKRHLLSLLLVTWYGESRFARDVHEGKLGIYGSDDARAACLGQIHQRAWLPKDKWQATKGTDLKSTVNCALATARALQSAAATCRWDASPQAVKRALRQYGVGNGDCDPAKASERSLERINRRTRSWVATNHKLYAATQKEK